jgi:palmitoyl-protein thioesterase
MKKNSAVEKLRWGYQSRPLPEGQYAPTVIFHGIGQQCSEELLANLVEEINLGTNSHTECIEIGNGARTSVASSVNSQAEEACQKILEHPVFSQQEFNIVGLSQGSLIARYIAESCPTEHPVRNLVTLGAPNNGVEYQDDCYH